MANVVSFIQDTVEKAALSITPIRKSINRARALQDIKYLPNKLPNFNNGSEAFNKGYGFWVTIRSYVPVNIQFSNGNIQEKQSELIAITNILPNTESLDVNYTNEWDMEPGKIASLVNMVGDFAARIKSLAAGDVVGSSLSTMLSYAMFNRTQPLKYDIPFTLTMYNDPIKELIEPLYYLNQLHLGWNLGPTGVDAAIKENAPKVGKFLGDLSDTAGLTTNAGEKAGFATTQYLNRMSWLKTQSPLYHVLEFSNGLPALGNCVISDVKFACKPPWIKQVTQYGQFGFPSSIDVVLSFVSSIPPFANDPTKGLNLPISVTSTFAGNVLTR